jgi:acetoin utilization deacetylase AcuC-like enzyme
LGLYFSHPSSLEHDTGAHPENASRLPAIEAALGEAGWPGLERVKAPAATREQIGRVHTAEHIDAIERFAAAGGGMLDLDTIMSERSFEAALHAAGGPVDAVERLLAGEDVHHGNGTEAIFAGSDRVLYTSIHQWPLYPGTGPAEYVGTGAGEGYTVNLPVPPGSGSETFLSLVQHVVVPIAREFRPGLVAISAGYDAHRDDPLAECSVDTEGYAHMAATVRALAADLGVPVLVCLEGGYEPSALAASVVATVETLGSDDEAPEAPSEPAAAFAERHRERWPALLA